MLVARHRGRDILFLMAEKRKHRQRIGSLLEPINGRGYCLTDKISPNQLLI